MKQKNLVGRIKALIYNRVHGHSGETIVETLFTMLVVSLAMLMLAGAIVSAARVNKGTKDLDTAFHTDGGVNNEGTVSVKSVNGTVKISRGGAGSDSVSVTYYVTQDDNEYWYYK